MVAFKAATAKEGDNTYQTTTFSNELLFYSCLLFQLIDNRDLQSKTKDYRKSLTT